MNDNRNYALDLLKIISMLMVVLLHLGSHCGMQTRYGGNPFLLVDYW